jgi:hypothetical protein
MSDRSRKGHPFGSIAANFGSARKPTEKPGDLAPMSTGGTTVAVPGRVGKDPSGLYKLLAAVRAAGCDDVTVVVSDPLEGLWPSGMGDTRVTLDAQTCAIWEELGRESWDNVQQRRNRTTH